MNMFINISSLILYIYKKNNVSKTLMNLKLEGLYIPFSKSLFSFLSLVPHSSFKISISS